MHNDSIELHKIHAKISKMRKVQSDALSLPSFSPPVSEQLAKILDKIRLIDEQSKFAITHNRIFVDKITKYIPEIVELSQQNFLQSAIIDLQTQLSSIYTLSLRMAEMASSVSSSRGKIVTQLKQIMSRALMISYHKVSPTVFVNVQQMLINMTNELTKLGSGAWKDILPQFPTLLPKINDVDTLLKHLTAAHSFIFTAESLQNSLRKVQQKNPDIQLPLRSNMMNVEPVKPIVVPPEPVLISNTQVDDLLEQLKKNPENIDEFFPKFETALNEDFKFYSPAEIVQEILMVALTIHPPLDLKSKLFSKSFRLFKDLTVSIRALCQLPHYAYSKNDISNFENAMNNVEKSVDSIAKARKKPTGWTAEKAKIMIHKFEEYIILGKNIIKAVETVEKINHAIEPRKIPLDLSKFHLKPVESRFTNITYPSNNRLRYITILRALNTISNDIENLTSKGLIFTAPNPQLKEIHPLSFKEIFRTIQNTTENLESDIFRFSISAYNEFPVSKSGVTVLSCFAELQRMLEYSILSMHLTPILTLNFRMMSMFLFEQGFPLSSDDNIDIILKGMASVFDAYVMFNKLETIGSISLNNAAQLCFLTTICDELSEYKNDVFSHYRDYFASVNLFDVDNESILEQISALHRDTINVLNSWSCNSIVSNFTQYTKTIYTCSTQLKRVSVEPLLSKLLAQLSSWLGNLSRTLPKPANLREMQIRMSVLQQLFCNFLEANPEIKKQIPYEQLIEVINLFKKLRDIFSTKTRLKQLLSFLERVQVNTEDYFSGDTSSSELETNSNTQQSPDDIESAEIMNNETEDGIRFQFTTEEVNMWIPFSQTILKSSCHAKKKELPVTFLSPKLIYRHFTHLVSKYCDMWRLEASFSQEIAQAFGPMLTQDVEITIPGLKHFFTSNIKRFEGFRDRITIHIEQHIEKLLKSLNEFAPAPRGRGFQREAPPAHPNAPLIADVIRGLQGLCHNITGTDFSWYPELVRLYHQLNPLLDEMSFASDGVHPCYLFRRLCRKAYLCFLCSRCFQIFSSNLIPYGPDLESLRCLITDFMENPSLANDNTAIMRHQIENIMNSDIGCDTFVFESSMKLMRRSLSLLNIRAIVEMIDADFFGFDEFFGKLPPNISSLSTLLSSRLFETVEEARKALFNLISSNYDDTLAHKCVQTLLAFSNEISSSPFEIDKSNINNSITACRTLQSLSDVSSTFDCLDVFTPKSNDSNLINGSWVLRVRILLIALESRLETLMNLAAPQFRDIFKLFRPVAAAVEKIPDRFGYIDSSQNSFEDLQSSWKEFCSNFTPVNLISQWTKCKQITTSIPNVLLSSIDHPDIVAFSKFTKTFNVTHNPNSLIRLRLAVLFIEKQVKRYMPNPEFIIFPFCEMQNILTILTKYDEFCKLIPCVTERINTVKPDDPISNPQSYNVYDTEPFQEEIIENSVPESNPSSDINESNSLTFDDQVSIAQMIDTFFDANSIIKDQLAQLPFLKEQVNSLEPYNKNLRRFNESLQEINKYLGEPVREMRVKLSEAAGKAHPKVDEMIQLNMLKARAKIESEQCKASQNYFDSLNKFVTNTEIALEHHVGVQRQKRFEKECKKTDLCIEEYEALLNASASDELKTEEYREKLNLLCRPLSDKSESQRNKIIHINPSTDEIDRKAQEIRSKTESTEKLVQVEESLNERKYTIEELQKLKAKYLKDEEQLTQYLSMIKSAFD